MSSNFEKKGKGFSFTAIFLIILGIIFLLNNFGVFPWEIWQNIWKFWPILLILFGVEALLGRNSSPKSLGLLLILIFIVPIILILNPLTGNPLATKTLSLSKPLGNLTKASFVFNLLSINLKVTSLQGSPSGLFQGELKYSQLLPAPKFNEDRRFGEAKYTFVQEGEGKIPFSGNLGNTGTFNFTNLVPLELTFNSNTGVFDLNLTNLHVSLVEIDSTAGSATIVFAKDFATKVFIKTQAAVIKLQLPTEVGATVKIDSSIKSLNIDDKRFKKIDANNYKAINYDQVSIKNEIEISGSAASVEVK